MVATDTATTRDLSALIRQDATAFTALVAEFEPIVAGLAQSLGLAGADIDEAVADVFVNIYRALPGFDGRSQLRTWIYRIACRRIIKARTQLRRHTAVPLDPAVCDANQSGPGARLEEQETNRQVWQAVAQLEPRQALAVELYYRRQMPLEEVAEAIECRVGTVKTLLFRARNRLRHLLTQAGVCDGPTSV
jgi:RNA polymerase sigma-70 factor (ECF subfamily)